jgi:hypothetical protein
MRGGRGYALDLDLFGLLHMGKPDLDLPGKRFKFFIRKGNATSHPNIADIDVFGHYIVAEHCGVNPKGQSVFLNRKRILPFYPYWRILTSDDSSALPFTL